jgi:hypothetical protein
MNLELIRKAGEEIYHKVCYALFRGCHHRRKCPRQGNLLSKGGKISNFSTNDYEGN